MQASQILQIANHPVSEYIFENGFRLLLVEKRSAPVVGIFRAVEAGSADEPGLVGRGVAHFIEHMDFRKQEKTTWGLEKKYGVELNAYTNEYMTGYHEVGHKNQLHTMLDDDFARFESKEVPDAWLKTEMQAVLNEEDRGNNASGVLWRETPKHALEKSHYSEDTIGEREDILHAKADQMTTFRETFYVPNNTTLIIAGDINADEVVEKVRSTYGTLPRAADVVHSNPAEPPRVGKKSIEIQRPAPCMMFTMSYPAPHALTHSSAVASVVEQIWESRENKYIDAGLVHSVGMYAARMRDPFLLVVHGSIPGSDKTRLRSALTRFQQDLSHFTPTVEELERAKKHLATAYKSSFSSVMNIIQTLGASAGLGDWTDAEKHAVSIQNVTIEEVQHFCAHRFKESQSSIVSMIPDREAQALVDIPRHVEMKQGTVEENVVDTVHAEKHPTVVYVSTPDATAIHMRVTAAIDPSKQVAAEILAQCMGNGCVIRDHTYTADQCDLELSKRSAERTFTADRGYIHAALHLPIESKDKLTAASIVVNGELFAPTIDKKTFLSAKRSLAEELNASRSDPTTMCKHRLMKAMFSTSPYDKSIDEQVQDIQHVSLKHVNALKASLKHSVTAVTVSRIDNTQDRFDTFVARLQKPCNVQRLQWVAKPKEAVEEQFSIPGNASNVLMMGQVTSLRHDDPKIYALRAAVHALGGGMSGRLMSTIRGKMGLGTYGVYATLHYSPDYPAFLVVHGTFAPASAAAGAKKLQEMLVDWATNGLTEEELSMWKSQFQGPRAMALDTPSSIVDTHHDSLLQGQDPQEVWDAFPHKVQQVSIQDVQNILHEQIQPMSFITVKCGDIPPAITADDVSDDEE
jgi:zinc protease